MTRNRRPSIAVEAVKTNAKNQPLTLGLLIILIGGVGTTLGWAYKAQEATKALIRETVQNHSSNADSHPDIRNQMQTSVNQGQLIEMRKDLESLTRDVGRIAEEQKILIKQQRRLLWRLRR